MAKPLRVLFVEDREKDVELLVRELRRGGYDLVQERVDTPEALASALDQQEWDIILCDYRMPRFSATAALALVKEKKVDLPFIVISGTVGEEIAVEALRAGAHDFMSKGKLARLLPAIERELRDAEVRRERRHAQRELLASEDRLRKSERRFHDLFEFAPDAIVITNRQGIITLANRQAERMFGWTRPELVGQPVELLMPQQDQQGHVALREGYLRSALPHPMGGGRLNLRGLRKDGTEFPLDISLSPMEADGELLVAEAVRDITDRTQLQAQLLQAQKMESVGQLAGGIAHDFSNLLTVIIGAAELAATGLGEGDPLHKELAVIRDSGARAAALTRQLLAFSRKQVLHPTVVDLNTVVANVEAMLRRVIGEHIDLVARPGEGLASVKVDPGQIEQVILNLAINSRDAMPNGGTLTIETGNVLLDETYAKSHAAVQPGPHVMLALSDTGSGMDEATRQRVFEPFFTTKASGKGTGLGLSTAYGIIKQSGGDIWAYSELGVGTTFKIYLPQVEEAPREDRPVVVVAAARGTECILIVEDEESLRGVARRILESAGYTVLVAGTGAEALRLLERDLGRVHLLLTDVVMPGMSGRDLAKRLEVGNPEMKILYTSGYSEDAIASNGMLDEGVHFIGKPYTIAELTHKVREVLDS